MSVWIDSYRGSVKAWECDTTEHFTVAYYFDRFADSTLRLLEHHGVGLTSMRERRRGNATVDCFVTYAKELRAGDPFHIESAIIGVEEKGVRAGHKLYNSATGELCSTLEQYMVHIDMDARRAAVIADDQRQRLEAAVAAWDGPKREERAQPASDEGFILSHRDTTKPWEIDVVGHVGFQFYVHRFSSAGAQLFAAMGLDSDYQRENRLGFSTFEFQLRFRRELDAGAIVDVKSALVHLGGSSIRIQHRLYNAATDELSAVLDQFGVMLDLDARRPTRVPEDIRERAKAVLVPA